MRSGNAPIYSTAFGNIMESTGNVDNNITYAGYQYDEETGLYYLNARMYDPKIARFLQEDTYTGDPKDPLSLNLYTYGHNNPIKYYDPTGHFINLISGAIGAGAGFIIGAGASMISDLSKGELKRDNWKKYVGAGAQGAIVGGVAGLTAGLGLGVVATAGIGVAAGAVGNTANQVIRNDGFKDFSRKELLVSSISSGVGFGAGKLINSTAGSLTSNISSEAVKQTAQGAIVGATSGASGSLAANVTSQAWDIKRGETDEGEIKEKFDFGSLAKDTLIGGAAGGIIGGAFGFGSSKYGAKVNELDTKINNSIKQGANKFVESSKTMFNKLISDETGSIRISPKGSGGNNAGVGGGNPKAKTYYQVTSKESASKILSESEITGKEFKEIYAWTEQPTLKQAKASGARNIETVIKFETNTAFEVDTTVAKNLQETARVSMRPGPISVQNVTEVGFKKPWWKFWGK